MRITTLTAAALFSVLSWQGAQAQPLCSDVGPERVTTVTTRRTVAWGGGALAPAPIGERFAYRRGFVSDPGLEPIGERVYTRRYFARPALEPIGERVYTRRVAACAAEPIGERVVTRRTVTTRTTWQQPAPIGERVVYRRGFVADPGLEPVGERVYTRRYFARPALEPIGERVYTRRVSACAAEPIGERVVTRRTVTTTTVARPLPIGEQLDGASATVYTNSTLAGRRDLMATNAVIVNDGGRARAVWTDDAGVVHSLPVRSTLP